MKIKDLLESKNPRDVKVGDNLHLINHDKSSNGVGKVEAGVVTSICKKGQYETYADVMVKFADGAVVRCDPGAAEEYN